jgi:uncharacterized membrane protein YkvA (DUF1232 family)
VTRPREKRLWRAVLGTATGVLGDHARTLLLADRAMAKATAHRGLLEGFWGDLTALIRMLRAWATRRYKRVPWQSLVLTTVAVVYFVMPLDAVPDFIPVIGFIDDGAVIAFVVRSIRADIAAFRAWEVEMKAHGNEGR